MLQELGSPYSSRPEIKKVFSVNFKPACNVEPLSASPESKIQIFDLPYMILARSFDVFWDRYMLVVYSPGECIKNYDGESLQNGR